MSIFNLATATIIIVMIIWCLHLFNEKDNLLAFKTMLFTIILILFNIFGEAMTINLKFSEQTELIKKQNALIEKVLKEKSK